MADEFEWTEQDSREAQYAAYGLDHPWTRGRSFLICIQAPQDNMDVLSVLVTPESLARWGDFAPAQELLASWDNWGIPSFVRTHPHADDIAYLPIYRNDSPVPTWQHGALSFVWRPDTNGWMVHAIGPELSPEEMPRTSPGVAPPVAR